MFMIRHPRPIRQALAITLISLATSASQAADTPIPPAVSAAVADANRPQADRDKDAGRKPAESVAFAGIKPGDKVGDLLAGGGYFTRIFSRAVGDGGVVYATGFALKADAPAPALETLAAEPAYKNVRVLRGLPAEIKFPEPLDVAWTSLNYHDIHNQNGHDAFNKAVFAALKPGGTYIVIDHAAAAGSGANDARTLHRIDAALVRQEVESAGFKFVAEGSFLKNPNDPHTATSHDASVRWNTDQFIFRFVKPD
jgi:predicted methyltransferase